MKHLLLCFALFTAAEANAYVDQQCARNCTSQGGGYGFCQSRCEFDGMPQMQSLGSPQPDRACVAQCTSAGYAYMFCQQRCR